MLLLTYQEMNKLDVSQAFMRGSRQFKMGPVKMMSFVYKDAMTGMQTRMEKIYILKLL